MNLEPTFDTVEQPEPILRKRGRPSVISQELAEEIAYRIYLSRLEPPIRVSEVGSLSISEDKLRKYALSYVPIIRSMATILVELGYTKSDLLR